MRLPFTKTLSEADPDAICTIIAVRDNSPSFLQYVTKLGLKINTEIKVLDKQEFDQSMELEVKDQKITVSKKFAENILIG